MSGRVENILNTPCSEIAVLFGSQNFFEIVHLQPVIETRNHCFQMAVRASLCHMQPDKSTL
jgi:hypothetical protein